MINLYIIQHEYLQKYFLHGNSLPDRTEAFILAKIRELK